MNYLLFLDIMNHILLNNFLLLWFEFYWPTSLLISLSVGHPLFCTQVIITSQYLGSLFYGIPVWNNALLKKDKCKHDTLHYSVLRTAVKGWHRELPRDMLDNLRRTRPYTFAKYSLGSIIINASWNTLKTQCIQENPVYPRTEGTLRSCSMLIQEKRLGDSQ